MGFVGEQITKPMKYLFFIALVLTTSCKVTSDAVTQESKHILTPQNGLMLDCIFFDEVQTIEFWTYFPALAEGHTVCIRKEHLKTEIYKGVGDYLQDRIYRITFKVRTDEYFDFKENYSDITLTVLTE